MRLSGQDWEDVRLVPAFLGFSVEIPLTVRPVQFARSVLRDVSWQVIQ